MKRPLGLKSALKNDKRLKSSDEEMVVELDASSDEIQELESLYDAALHKLTMGSEDACSLFRGVVHECDKFCISPSAISTIFIVTKVSYMKQFRFDFSVGDAIK